MGTWGLAGEEGAGEVGAMAVGVSGAGCGGRAPMTGTAVGSGSVCVTGVCYVCGGGACVLCVYVVACV